LRSKPALRRNFIWHLAAQFRRRRLSVALRGIPFLRGMLFQKSIPLRSAPKPFNREAHEKHEAMTAPQSPAPEAKCTPLREKYTRCKYCGAKLKQDHIGQYCGTRSCQWEYSLPSSDDTKPKHKS
jgi:hypothetical protein